MRLAFRALLTGSAAITAHVPSDRISWGTHPQKAPYPGIVLNVIGNADGLTLKGPDGLWQGRVQVDCYAEDYSAVVTLSKAVINLLSGHKGGGFQGIFLAGQRDSHADEPVGRLYRISIDFRTHWRDT